MLSCEMSYALSMPVGGTFTNRLPASAKYSGAHGRS